MRMCRLLILSFLLLQTSYSFSKDTGNVIRVPLRVSFVSTEKYAPLNVADDTSIEKTIEIVNLIWSQANIEFYIDNIKKYKSSNVFRYENVITSNNSTRKEKVGALRSVCPKPRKSTLGIDICVVSNSFSPKHGGVAFNFTKFSPMAIWPLFSNGSSDQNPATLAHEIGHTLGLKHAGVNDIYLMRGAGNNIRRVGRYDEIRLNENEIKIAREVAKKLGTY